jgi:hypothetical protein
MISSGSSPAGPGDAKKGVLGVTTEVIETVLLTVPDLLLGECDDPLLTEFL